jgi:hypothetical protein
LPCPTGFSSIGGFVTSCDLCDSGRYSEVVNSSVCTDYPLGKFSAVAGQTFCDQCGDGWFTTNGITASKSSCQACSPGKFTNSSSSIECLNCPFGRWSNTTAATSGATCNACPAFVGISCLEATAIPFVSRGYFRTLISPGVVIPCHPDEACLEAGWGNTSCNFAFAGSRFGSWVSIINYLSLLYHPDSSNWEVVSRLKLDSYLIEIHSILVPVSVFVSSSLIFLAACITLISELQAFSTWIWDILAWVVILETRI